VRRGIHSHRRSSISIRCCAAGVEKKPLGFFSKNRDDDFNFHSITFRNGKTTLFIEEVGQPEFRHSGMRESKDHELTRFPPSAFQNMRRLKHGGLGFGIWLFAGPLLSSFRFSE
jgi:hypothetical protein